jgi:hypothetical protein
VVEVSWTVTTNEGRKKRKGLFQGKKKLHSLRIFLFRASLMGDAKITSTPTVPRLLSTVKLHPLSVREWITGFCDLLMEKSPSWAMCLGFLIRILVLLRIIWQPRHCYVPPQTTSLVVQSVVFIASGFDGALCPMCTLFCICGGYYIYLAI